MKQLTKSADAGHACARFNLGLLLEAGFESAQDKEAASEWLKGKAAKMRSAKLSLADFNESRKSAAPERVRLAADGALDQMLVGCGGTADRTRARSLYAEAARHGLDRARCVLGLRNLYRVHTPSEKQDGPLELLSACSSQNAVAMFALGLLHLFNRTPSMPDSEECRRRAYEFFQKAAHLGHARSGQEVFHILDLSEHFSMIHARRPADPCSSTGMAKYI